MEAFFELAQNAAPGVDRLTWKDYEADLECNIEDLHERVQRGAYRALPSRRVYIPKGDGTNRPLGIPTIRDRVAQMAVKIVMEPIFEADFEDCNFGFRPKKDAHQAVGVIREALNDGCPYVLDADLQQYFDTIVHDKLMKLIA